jgi:hypothetical protein
VPAGVPAGVPPSEPAGVPPVEPAGVPAVGCSVVDVSLSSQAICKERPKAIKANQKSFTCFIFYLHDGFCLICLKDGFIFNHKLTLIQMIFNIYLKKIEEDLKKQRK